MGFRLFVLKVYKITKSKCQYNSIGTIRVGLTFSGIVNWKTDTNSVNIY